MSDLFLDLRDRAQTLDFIAEALDYVSPTARKRLEKDPEVLMAGRSPEVERLAALAKEAGRKSWAARRALQSFLASQNGCEIEWRKIVGAVSDSTAHLLERFRHGTKCESLNAVLGHDESASAFRDLERFEIAEVRRHARAAIWRDQRGALAKEAESAEKKLAAIVKRLDTLRELAGEAPQLTDEIMSKLERYEDRLYFEGEELDVKVLDEEIRYYREEKEIPAGER